MEAAGKRVAVGRGDADEGPTIIEMEDPDAPVLAEVDKVEGRGLKNPRVVPAGEDMGGEKRAAPEKKIVPRAATSATFDGLGVRGGLSVAGVCNEDVSKLLRPNNEVTPEIIDRLLDTGVETFGRDGIGLRKALEEQIDSFAWDWSVTIEKVLDVIWLSLRRACRVLEGGGEAAIALRKALASIFKDGKDQRALEHFLAQTAFLVNDWRVEKPLCCACVEKLEWVDHYGYDVGIFTSRILRVKSSDPAGKFVPLSWVKENLTDKLREDGCVYVGQGRIPRPRMSLTNEYDFETVGARKVSDNDWKQVLNCSDGDVLILDFGSQATVDFVPVSLIWCAQTRTKLEKPLSGLVPKKCV